MNKLITTIVTIPDMITSDDWQLLSKKSDVQYIERDKVSEDELLDIIAKSDYLMLNRDVVDELTDNFYKQIRERRLPLKAISTDITGMSWAAPEAAKKHGMLLMNTPNYSTVSVAEFSLTALLFLIKKLNLVFQDRITGKEEKPYKNDVLTGKTVGIVGLGHIGTKFAELLQGFGVKIIAWDRKEKNIPNVTQLSLEEVLRQSDYLSLHLKTADETIGLFDAKLLAHAKEGQYIINEADGKLVDNDALLEALNSGKVGGYAGSNSAVAGTPLAKHQNVIAFPSQAWFTDHSLNLLRQIWVGNIIATIDGKPENVMD
jgi:phosphoglycerate dehydrogenase-like enzyme